MKEIYKNPIMFYVLVPILLLFWPVAVRMVYMPRVEGELNKAEQRSSQMEGLIGSIMTIDPGRLVFDGKKDGTVKFDYVSAVDRVAKSNNISPENYKISSKPIRKSKGQKSQGAKLSLSGIDITRFAKFMSDIQLRWASLQCEKVSLTKQEGFSDKWKIEVDFKYFY